MQDYLCFFVISDQGCNMFSESYPKREDMFVTTYALNQFTGVDCVTVSEVVDLLPFRSNFTWNSYPSPFFYAIVLRKLQLDLDINIK
jgi:hypothetical protein